VFIAQMRKEKPTLEIGLQSIYWVQFLAFNIGIKYVFIAQMRMEKQHEKLASNQFIEYNLPFIVQPLLCAPC
jgi:hypothetical protein